nr:MAG TPA_asm: hypothetical protein [Bacteriophage sp.]
MIHLIFSPHSNYIKITPETQTYVPVFTHFILCLATLINVESTTFISVFHILPHTMIKEHMFC